MVAVGKNPPALTLKNQDDQTVSLADYADQWVALYFYPRDDTPGCTKEACEFTKGIAAFRKLGAVVLGCSPDSPDLHRVFIRKHKLRVPLLSDPMRQTMERYEAWGEKKLYGRATVGIRRSTVLIDPAGPEVPDRLDEYATIFCFMFMRCTNLYVLMFAVSLSTACVEEALVPVSSGSDIFLRADIQIIEEVVPRRATLAGLLNAHALDGQMAFDLIEAIRPVFNPRRIRVGNPYRLVLDDDGTLRRFEYHVDDDQFLRVTNQSGTDRAFDAKLIPYVKERAEIAMRGAIDGQHSSLVSAIDGGGESVMLAIRMAEVFAGEIDFSNDLRRGDHFEVLFEKYLREDEFSGYGDILAAEFHNDGRRLQAFSYKLPGDDEPLYYDEQGRSLKRLFLRSPFRFEPRVTSRFSYRRLHPVLGNHRPHLGVDYGASIGTPVIAVANGRVVSAARSGGSGNMIRLRHTNGYETYYLHLSSFATGMRAGSRVVQGQIIGRVGATGLVTGPHLDFRMRKNGTFVNPLIEHRNLPPGDPVPEEHLAEFHEVRERALRRMQLPSRQVDVGRTFTQ